MKAVSADRTVSVPGRSPETTGYLLLSGAVDGRSAAPSGAKRELIAALKGRATRLRRDMFATIGVLTARRLVPSHSVRGAAPAPERRYDVAVLLQAPSVESAQWLLADPAFVDLHDFIARSARGTHVAVIRNVRRHQCRYDTRTRRLYLLMTYPPGEPPPVAPAWGWTDRGELIWDLAFSPELRRFRRGCGEASGPTLSVLFGQA